MAVKFGQYSMLFGDLGIGPTGLNEAPRYTTTANLVPSPSNIGSIVDKAIQYNMCIPVNLAGNRGRWTINDGNGCKIFQQDMWNAEVDAYSPDSLGDALYRKVAQAFVDQYLISFTGDELHADGIFCGSCPSSTQNELGLYIKNYYPGAITSLRIPANHMPVPAGGWTGIDYCWAQYQYKGNPCGNDSFDPGDCFDEQLALAQDAGVGLITGLNWWNDKWNQTWDTDMNPSTPNSTLVGAGGTGQYVMSPDRIKAVADAVAIRGDVAPICIAYAHVNANVTQEPFHTYQYRSDFQSAFRYCLNTLADSDAGHAWATPKGYTPPTDGGPGTGLGWQFIGMGTVKDGNNIHALNVGFPSGMQDGDLIVLVGYSRTGERAMAMPTGYAATGHVIGGVTYGDLVAYTKKRTTEGDSGTGDGHEYVATDWGNGTGTGCTQIAFTLVFRGALQTGVLLDVVSAASTWAAANNMGPITGLTAGTSGALALVIGARQDDYGNGIPVPAGTLTKLSGDSQTWSDPLIAGSVTGLDAAVAVTYAFLSGTPTLTAKTYATSITGAAAAGCGFMVTFKPIPGTSVSVPNLDVIGNKFATVGQQMTFTANASGGGVSYTLTGAPSGMTINHTTGVVTWTPASITTATITVTATNTAGSDSETLVVTVRAVPVLGAIGNKSVTEGTQLSIPVSATGSGISFSTIGAPGGTSFTTPVTDSLGATGSTFRWTPGVGSASGSPYVFQIVASNTSGTDSETISVTVIGPGPALAPIGPRTIEKGFQLRIFCTATSPTNAPLTFSIDPADRPAGTSITSNGTFTWEPATAGVFTCTIKVTDGTFTDSEQITITVIDTPTDSRRAIITGLVASTAYDVRIAHVDPVTGNLGDFATQSPYAVTSGAVPASPTILAASAISLNGFTVNWTNGITGVGVTTTVEYRQSGASAWTVVSGIASGVTSKLISALLAGTVYDVRVKHISSGVDSAYATSLGYVTTTANPPSVGTPTGFAITHPVGVPDTAVLAWTRGEFSVGSTTLIYEGTSNNFANATLFATQASSTTSRTIKKTLGTGSSITLWYWIRHALANGLQGTLVGPVSTTYSAPGSA